MSLSKYESVWVINGKPSMHFSFIVSMVLFLFFAILFCTLIFKVAYKLILDDNTDDKTITVHSLVAGKLHFEKKKKAQRKNERGFCGKEKISIVEQNKLSDVKTFPALASFRVRLVNGNLRLAYNVIFH